jgi:hypothetical protein
MKERRIKEKKKLSQINRDRWDIDPIIKVNAKIS